MCFAQYIIYIYIEREKIEKYLLLAQHMICVGDVLR